MKIKYEFMTGERLELEVDDNIGEIMIEMEKTQSRRNQTGVDKKLWFFIPTTKNGKCTFPSLCVCRFVISLS